MNKFVVTIGGTETNKFQVGDKVRCANIPSTFRAEFGGHEYLTVSHVYGEYIGILEFQDMMANWHCNPFELVERAQQPADVVTIGGTEMNKFQVGDKVRCLGLSNEAHRKEFGGYEYLTVSCVNDQFIGILEFDNIAPLWDTRQFELVDWPTQAETTPKLVENPNAAMIEADEKKLREYAKTLVNELERDNAKLKRQIAEAADCPIEKHLTNAIEKTINRAEHPQAMWSI